MSRRIRLNAVQTLTVSFALLIFAGGLLLTLPFAAQDGRSIPFTDALFTAASASCVTGLSLYDTASQFSPFGQVVILLLIQVGGLGFMTVSILVSLLLKRRVSLHRRAVLMDTVGALQLGGVVRLTRRALLVTGVCEGLGALLLAVWFCPRYGIGAGLWMAVFHAVSAYCNAGFDLFGTGSSLSTAAAEPLLNVVIMLLIICGGLGFLVWDDLLTHGRKFRRWRLHSKVVVVFTAVIFAAGAAAFYFTESRHAFANVPAPQKMLMAAFQSVTARTAGFSTVDQATLSQSGTLLMFLLMFIGAGSGSTGGGAKVNTVAVLLLSSFARVRRQEDVNAFQRRLDLETIHKAYSSVSLYLMACLAGCMVLCLQGITLDNALFESISAIGTVGLSRGVTASLPELSKWAVLLMMFSGRVGSMSVAMAVTRERPQPKRRTVPEKILMG